ncbi:MAG: pilin [Candidatus Saccharimonadales bacterium]
MKRLLAFLLTGFILSMPVANVGIVYAQNPLDQACESLDDPSQSSSCTQDAKKNPLTGPNGLLSKITSIVALLSGVAAVIMLMIGGFRFITANGDSQAATNARKTVFSSVIGLIVIVAAWSIVAFVLRSF